MAEGNQYAVRYDRIADLVLANQVDLL